MRAYVIRTTTYRDGSSSVRDFAVLTDSLRSAMVAVIRNQPIGVMIEVTDRDLAVLEITKLGLKADEPKLIS